MHIKPVAKAVESLYRIKRMSLCPRISAFIASRNPFERVKPTRHNLKSLTFYSTLGERWSFPTNHF